VIIVPASLAAPPKGVKPVPPITLDPVGTAIADSTPSGAGAMPVEVSLALRLELQCGRLGPGPVIVSLPAAMHVPDSLARGAILLNGNAPSTARLAGHVVTLTHPPANGILCASMAPGTLTIVFPKSAGFGNPRTAGRYPVVIRAGRAVGTAHLIVS